MCIKRWVCVGSVCVAVSVTVLLLLVFGWRSAPTETKEVFVGDTKAAVCKKLGRPSAKFTNLFVTLKYGGEVWAYGQNFNPQSAITGGYPINMRIFGPITNDLLVIFDASGAVKAISNPKD